jgi:hypothetical protein
VEDFEGESVVYLVEGVQLQREGFSLEARNLVLWGDPERIRKVLGPMLSEAGGKEGGRRKGPAEEKGEGPLSGAFLGQSLPPELRAVLGPVLHSLYAEGEVRFTLGNRTFRTERLYVDFRRRILSTGKVQFTQPVGIPSRGRTLPLIVRAARMRKTSEDRLLLEDAEYTTCDFADPHYSFRCSELSVTDDEDGRTFTAYGNVLQVEGIPILWLPILSASSELSARPLRTASYRHSNRFDHEFALLWADDIRAAGGRWAEWRLHTDWKTRRGPGVGPEVEYDYGPYRGELKAYYQQDTANTDAFDGSPVPREDRGRVRWEHRHRLGKGTRIDLLLHDFSDRNFQPEYLKDEFLQGQDPETYACLLSREGTDFASLTAKVRMDGFRTETTELPEGAFRRIAASLPAPAWLLDGLAWSADLKAGAYERQWDEATGLRGDREVREDLVARIEGRRWVGPVSLAPIAVAGATATHGLRQPGVDGDRVRADLAAGLRGTVEARRDFEGVASDLLDLDGLRHLASLEGLWYDRWAVTQDPAGAWAVDRIDTLEELRVVNLRFRNRLQTTRGNRRVDWIDLELRGSWFPSGLRGSPSPLRFKEEGLEEARFQDFAGEEKYRALPPAGEWGPCEGDLRMRLREGLFLLGEAEYAADEHRVRTSATGVRWFVIPKFTFYVGRRTIARDSDVYTASADWFLLDRWVVHLSQQTDFRTDEGLKSEIAFSRVWHDFVLEISFTDDRASNDRTFSFSLIPTALWEAPTSAQRLGKLDYEAQRWYR